MMVGCGWRYINFVLVHLSQCLEAGPDGHCGRPAVVAVAEDHRFVEEHAKISLIAWMMTVTAQFRTGHAICNHVQVRTASV